jgi:mRNA interferase MazF
MVEHYIPHQGDIIALDFNPAVGREQKGKRPAVVVSNKIVNENSRFIWAIPITTGAKNYHFPLHIKLDERTQIQGKVLVEHMKAIDQVARDIAFIEKMPEDILDDVLYNIGLVHSKETK